MALKIVVETCTLCSACELECPNAAIAFTGDAFAIEARLCTECAGKFAAPQCAAICPVPDTCVPA